MHRFIKSALILISQKFKSWSVNVHCMNYSCRMIVQTSLHGHDLVVGITYGGIVMVVSQASVEYHCYYTRPRSKPKEEC